VPSAVVLAVVEVMAIAAAGIILVFVVSKLKSFIFRNVCDSFCSVIKLAERRDDIKQ